MSHMSNIESKAWKLVALGRVEVNDATFNDNDELVTATGRVLSSDLSSWYDVSIDPEGCECSCAHGEARPGRRHTHDLALQLAAQRQRGTT